MLERRRVREFEPLKSSILSLAPANHGISTLAMDMTLSNLPRFSETTNAMYP
jgi:hypothetical protein